MPKEFRIDLNKNSADIKVKADRADETPPKACTLRIVANPQDTQDRTRPAHRSSLIKFMTAYADAVDAEVEKIKKL